MTSAIELTILACVEEMPATGSQIMARYQVRTGEKLVRGTAYTTIKRMRDKGLLVRGEEENQLMPSPQGLDLLWKTRWAIKSQREH